MIVVLLIECVCLLLFRRWLGQSIVTLVQILGGSTSTAIWLYSVISLPGVLAHEIAHFFVAALLGLRTGTIALLPHISSDGAIELGSVQVERKDPVRLALVGLAPLLFGIPLVLWLTASVAATLPHDTLTLLTIIRSWLIFPHSLLLYILTTIALHMFPSNRDMNSWPVAALVLVGLGWGLTLLGIQLPQTTTLFSRLLSLMEPLAVGLGLTLVLVCISLLILKLTIMITRRALLYNKSR